MAKAIRVYVVTEWQCGERGDDAYSVLGVYSTEKKAEKAIAAHCESYFAQLRKDGEQVESLKGDEAIGAMNDMGFGYNITARRINK